MSEDQTQETSKKNNNWVSNFCDVCSVRSANMRMMGGDSGPTSISGDNQEEDEARNLHSVSSADTQKKSWEVYRVKSPNKRKKQWIRLSARK